MMFGKLKDNKVIHLRDDMAEGYVPVLTPSEWLNQPEGAVSRIKGKNYVLLNGEYVRCYVVGIDIGKNI